ncbi:MAG TPA: efflux RND transporter periplasmic adaptor subunit [Candidatus Limnocylindria bacterium]|nr:efflux RND transporter periplasmic adaptor subunit [Candidatus Limnocylindria bacterium]
MKYPLIPATLLAAALFAGCSKPPQAAAPQPPTVTVAPVEQREIVEFDEFTGRLDAVESVEIRPRVSGYLQEVRFQSGQLVKKGDVLFVIDPRTRKATLDRAEAELQRAQALAEIAERDAKRADQLLTSKTISPGEADQQIWNDKQAKAALLSAQAARESARLDLEFCEVKSPIDGRVSRALVTVGNNVSGVDGFTTLMTTVVSVDPIYAYSAVDEPTLLKFQRLLREKQLAVDEQGRVAVEMRLSDETGFPHKGYLESLDNRLDPASGSIALRTVYPNADQKLMPGLYARVRIPGSALQPVLLISENAVGTDQNQKFVLTLSTNSMVEYRPVQLGAVVDGKRVVRSGLKAGEEIVVNGLMRVRPGMPVTAMKEEPPKQTAQK